MLSWNLTLSNLSVTKFFAVKLPDPLTSSTAFPCTVPAPAEKSKKDWSKSKEGSGVQSCESSSERRYAMRQMVRVQWTARRQI